MTTPRSWKRPPGLLGPALALLLAAPFAAPFAAQAQKNSGPLLPVDPPRAAAAAPGPRRAAPPPATPTGRNPAVDQLAQSLPLDPETRDMRDRLPADTLATQRRLGLRPARGPVTDLRGHTPSPMEIADALAPR